MSIKETEKSNIKEYLLGNTEFINDEFEGKLMTDNNFFQEFQIQEEELIQDYADDNLSETEKKQFETHFLLSIERQEKVTFAQSLRRTVDQQAIKIEQKAKSQTSEKQKPGKFLSRLFLSPIPVAACLLVIAGVSTSIIWNNFLAPSENEIALASLNKAFDECPIGSRISSIKCTPKRKTRGDDNSKIDKLAFENAELKILSNVDKNPDAENLHALGRVFLAKKEFDRAIEELEKAEKLDANNAQIQNDLGVAYLEKSKEVSEENEDDRLRNAETAIKKFKEALALDPKFIEAQFNKSINLEVLKSPEEAKKEWKHYLELDSDSEWAIEANKRLKELN